MLNMNQAYMATFGLNGPELYKTGFMQQQAVAVMRFAESERCCVERITLPSSTHILASVLLERQLLHCI